MPKFDKIMSIGLALFIFLVMFSAIILPFFSGLYEKGIGSSGDVNDLQNGYCSQAGGLVACAGCNVTSGSGYATFLDTCSSLVARLNGTHCYSCTSFGYRTPMRGLLLFCLVVIIIVSALVISGIKKKRF
jgi:hypothetical protein